MNIAFNLAIPILVISPKNNGAITQDTDGEVIHHQVQSTQMKERGRRWAGRRGPQNRLTHPQTWVTEYVMEHPLHTWSAVGIPVLCCSHSALSHACARTHVNSAHFAVRERYNPVCARMPRWCTEQ